MPRVTIYEGGNIARQGTTEAKRRPADYGESILGRGLQIAGKAVSEYAEKEDQIEDLHDRNEADQRALEHLQFVRQQRAMVRETRGSGAQGVVRTAQQSLTDHNAELLGTARSERSRRYLEAAIMPRTIEETDNWDAYANTEFVKDRLATLGASETAAIEEAHDAPDDEAAGEHIAIAANRAEERARFEGHSDPDLIRGERAKATSRGWVGRARNLAMQDRPEDAWAIMDAHRGEILEADEIGLRRDLKTDLDGIAASSDAAAAEMQATPAPDAPIPPGETAFLPPVRARTTTSRGGEYGAPRSYGGHAGRDYAAPAGTPVYPMAAGRVKRVYRSEGGGNTVEVALAGGWTMRVLHLQDGSTRHLQEGEEVGVNDVIGGVGNTGTKSHGNHAHVEVYDPSGKRVDPASAIGQRVNTPPPDGRRVDLQSSYAYIDGQVENGNWTRARGERAKDKLRESAALNDTIRSRREDDASRAALEITEKLGDKFTSMTQIPADVRENMSPSDRIRLQEQAQQNAKPKPIPENGQTAMNLTLQAIYDPEGFKRANLGLYAHQITRGELESLAVSQAKMRTEPAHNSPTARLGSQIDAEIRRYAPDIGWDPQDGSDGRKGISASERQQYLRMFNGMRQHIERLTEGKREPTDAEMKAAFDRATLSVVQLSTGREARLNALGPGEQIEVSIPLNVITKIGNSYRSVYGRAPTRRELQLFYMQNLGRPGFW